MLRILACCYDLLGVTFLFSPCTKEKKVTFLAISLDFKCSGLLCKHIHAIVSHPLLQVY